MPKYRARSCPRCHYFVGYSISQPLFKRTESHVTSFCLNCNYRFPIHRLIRGTRRASAQFRRRHLRLINNSLPPSDTAELETRRERFAKENFLRPLEYARHLRVLGQELENRRLTAFNLECTGQEYWIWARPGTVSLRSSPLSGLGNSRFQKLWSNNIGFKTRAQGVFGASRACPPVRRFRYSLQDIDRIERNENRRRRGKKDPPPRHSLSQLLRAVGALVTQRGERLLGICWQELSIGLVVESAQGQREIEIFCPDDLYDLNTSMHLRRNSRVLSERPH